MPDSIAISIVPPSNDARARDRIAEAAARWKLTPREADVLELVVEGDANKEVAAKLATSIRTVEVHIGSILKKVGVESRSRLIARFWTEERRPR